MDGDGGGMDGGEMGVMSGVGMENTDGDGGAGMGDTDEDSASSVLQSMGYIESGAGMGNVDGDSTRSVTSVLQSVVIIAVVVFFGISCVYFLLAGILAMFGVQL